MFDTPESVYEIALIGESPHSRAICYTLRRGCLTTRYLKNGVVVLTLQLDGSKLQISSPCTWTSESQLVWSGELHGPLSWENPSILDGLRPIEEKK